MTGQLEYCSCPLCGSNRINDFYYDFSPYQVVACNKCGLWRLNPRLNEQDMLVYYADDDYFEGSSGLDEGYSDYALQEHALRPTFARFLKEMKRRGMTGRSLLEVGCGYGYLLDEAADYFDYRVGTDFSSGAVDRAVNHADHIVHGGLDSLNTDQQFDVIVAVEVIEHIYDPNRFVADLFARLKPGGWLLMATPDMGSRWRRSMGRSWPSFKLPEHVTYYDNSTLGKLYSRNGFEDVQELKFPHAFPLPVLLEKLKLGALPVPALNVWLPGVVLAMGARKPA